MLIWVKKIINWIFLGIFIAIYHFPASHDLVLDILLVLIGKATQNWVENIILIQDCQTDGLSCWCCIFPSPVYNLKIIKIDIKIESNVEFMFSTRLIYLYNYIHNPWMIITKNFCIHISIYLWCILLVQIPLCFYNLLIHYFDFFFSFGNMHFIFM